MTSRSRSPSRREQRKALKILGAKIAQANNLPITFLRYAEYTHTDTRWTFEAGWEQLRDGHWYPMDDTGIQIHSSPPASGKAIPCTTAYRKAA